MVMTIRDVSLKMCIPLLLAADCVLISACSAGSPQHSSSTPSSTSSVAAQPTTSVAAQPTTKSYDLGRREIGNQAFWQFTGTGTPWPKACESVVDTWNASDKAQPWWNLDEVMRGCMDRANGPLESSRANTPALKCAPQRGYQITIYNGSTSCQNADELAARYDLQGKKYQQIDSIDTWTCSSGTADSRPLIFQCVSDKDAEFGVYPAP